MCVIRLASIDAEETTSVTSALSESIGSWPITMLNWTPESFDLLGSLRSLRDKFSVEPLISIDVGTNREKVSTMAIFVRVNSGFTKDMMESSLASEYVDSYAALITNITNYLLAEKTSSVPDPDAVKEDVERILEWYTFLANVNNNQNKLVKLENGIRIYNTLE